VPLGSGLLDDTETLASHAAFSKKVIKMKNAASTSTINTLTKALAGSPLLAYLAFIYAFSVIFVR
jgi:hypothetical protein